MHGLLNNPFAGLREGDWPDGEVARLDGDTVRIIQRLFREISCEILARWIASSAVA